MECVLSEIMQSSGVKFGTSGARGLATAMTDSVCYIYTQGFLQYLEQQDELHRAGEPVAIAGDLRPSTERIMAAVARAASDRGYAPLHCGRIPSPAVALYGLENRCPAIMVTGSHIPDDRNGIKFNKASGEVLKSDEAGIVSQRVAVAAGALEAPFQMPAEDATAGRNYLKRYWDLFPKDCLAGRRIGFYQHSAVGRTMLVDLFRGLGAEVVPLAWSDSFVPVDTEAIRHEDALLARQWAREQSFDAIVSTDGDSDRPLISDERGEWLRGDLVGLLAARYLGARTICAPVSCNTALEKTGWFEQVHRTRIGSPYVIAAMNDAAEAGVERVVGYEANGGFLTQTAFNLFGRRLAPLPTRDAVLPILGVLLLATERNQSISELLADLPLRFTASGRIQNFPPEQGAKILAHLSDRSAIEELFGNELGLVQTIDRTDGLRITFQNLEIIHLRPSGNAPEFRCYSEAASSERVAQIQERSMLCLTRLLDSMSPGV